MPTYRVTLNGAAWEMDAPAPPTREQAEADWRRRQGSVDAKKVEPEGETGSAWSRVPGGGPSLGEAAATIGTGGLYPAVKQGYQMLRHPVENLPAWGATGMAVASGGMSLPVTAGLTALGAGGGEAYRQLIKRGMGDQDVPATSGEAAGAIGQSSAINGILSLLAMGAPRVLKGAGNWFGRSAMKTPVSILEDVPGSRKLGDLGAAEALVEKAYDKNLIPGTSRAARQARVGKGGIDELNATVQDALAEADAAGVRHNVGTEVVSPALTKTRDLYRHNTSTTGAQSLAAVEAERQAMKAHPDTSRPSKLPGATWRTFRDDVKPTALNEQKVAMNRGIADNEWNASMSPAGTQAQKNISGAMSGAIRAKVPRAGAALEDESWMIPLEKALQRAAWRGGNREVIPFKAAMRQDLGEFARMGLLDRPGTYGTIGYLLSKLGRGGSKLPPGAQVGIMELLKTIAGDNLMPPASSDSTIGKR